MVSGFICSLSRYNKIEAVMHSHPTYSLNTLLSNQQLQPQLYDNILHEIKSPLQEFSIDVTNDHSLSDLNLQRPAPKRPNIPPPPAHLFQ